jgi:hypothetical protein
MASLFYELLSIDNALGGEDAKMMAKALESNRTLIWTRSRSE